MTTTYTKELSFGRLLVHVTLVGHDYHLLLKGGERPHIGCTVLAVPRPSLSGSGQLSSTSSVLNLTGHKDEVLCRFLAEQIAARKNAVTVCSGGFHTDKIRPEQIQELQRAVRELAEEIE